MLFDEYFYFTPCDQDGERWHDVSPDRKVCAISLTLQNLWRTVDVLYWLIVSSIRGWDPDANQLVEAGAYYEQLRIPGDYGNSGKRACFWV